MKRGLILFCALFVFSAMADDPSEDGQACVQNFAKTEQGLMACRRFPQLYTFVTPVREDEGTVCARKYADFYCGTAPVEYKKATDREGKEVCVLDSDQPAVVNMCKAAPKSYTYIKLRP